MILVLSRNIEFWIISKESNFNNGVSPHVHILVWLDNAPEGALGKDYNQAIDLIDFLISVSATEASGNIKLQTHKHTYTLQRISIKKNAKM